MPGTDGGVGAGRRKAVAVLEALPVSRELAKAYVRLPRNIRDTDGRGTGAEWGKRALQLAEDLGDTETALEARRIVACGFAERGLEELGQVLEDAQSAGLVEQIGLTYLPLWTSL